jgi:hypothetical protein
LFFHEQTLIVDFVRLGVSLNYRSSIIIDKLFTSVPGNSYGQSALGGPLAFRPCLAAGLIFTNILTAYNTSINTYVNTIFLITCWDATLWLKRKFIYFN